MDLTTLSVAAVGLAGTLTSPLPAQRIAGLVKRREFEFHDRQQREECEAARQQAALELKRSIYANLNSAARQYQQELEEYVRLLKESFPMPARTLASPRPGEGSAISIPKRR